MRYLLVGDMHCTRPEIDDCRKIIDYIKTIVVTHKVEWVVFMGDQTNNHAVLDSYVMDFWKASFKELSKLAPIIVLVGNHDQANSKDVNTIDSMSIFKNKRVSIIDRPTISLTGICYVPYIHDSAEFIKIANSFPKEKTLICHQSFNGARYENGHPIEDGADANKVPQQHIFSGHIHNKSKFGKLNYVGSPRWRVILDSNQEKSLLMVDFVDGVPVETKEFPTNTIVPKFHAFKDTEDEPCEIGSMVKEGDKVCVDVYGSFGYVERRRLDFPKSYRVRVFPVHKASITVKESDGTDVALSKFLNSFVTKHGSDKDLLIKEVKERLKEMK